MLHKITATSVAIFCAFAAYGAETLTTRDLILASSIQSYGSIVDYCVEKSPNHGAAVNSAFIEFSAKARSAVNGLTFRMGKFANTPIPQNQADQWSATMRSAAEKAAAEIQKYDPDSYCAWLETKLNAVTEESLYRSMDNYYRAYEEQARQKGFR